MAIDLKSLEERFQLPEDIIELAEDNLNALAATALMYLSKEEVEELIKATESIRVVAETIESDVLRRIALELVSSSAIAGKTKYNPPSYN